MAVMGRDERVACRASISEEACTHRGAAASSGTLPRTQVEKVSHVDVAGKSAATVAAEIVGHLGGANNLGRIIVLQGEQRLPPLP